MAVWQPCLPQTLQSSVAVASPADAATEHCTRASRGRKEAALSRSYT